MSVAPNPAAPAGPAPAMHGELARSFQEIFTVIVRIRSNRQAARDAASFRAHVKRLVAAADEEARRGGYDGDSVRLAVYAVVAFLDEAVLNSTEPMFADWPRQPLQEEVFGDHMAGETFFRNLSELLGRTDSEALADLLEVYQLCLVLGFRGRFAAGGEGEIHRFTSLVDDRLSRIRGGHPPLAPRAGLPAGESVPRARDPWVRRLVVAAGILAVVALAAYLAFRLSLGAGSGALESFAEALR
jgi:type VI secretion system protein ImpK